MLLSRNIGKPCWIRCSGSGSDFSVYLDSDLAQNLPIIGTKFTCSVFSSPYDTGFFVLASFS